ncbi:MAG: Lrp/AsnC family transcriptional regulator [Flavobacteriales bacterium]|jgi:DNA-binding Lrp family transcriptional regulator|nr:Lrp/AsnC family transcriptional regulator [Flavobacteriales bacterium]
MKLDKIDLSILKELQKNSKITNIELSKKIGLSAAPTLGRVQKLEKNGLIKSYHAKINAAKLGLGLTALIHVSLIKQIGNTVENFSKKVINIDEIIECLQLTGKFDYQLKVMVKDIQSFEYFLANKLNQFDEISKIHTSIILSSIKQNSIIPIDYKSDYIL